MTVSQEMSEGDPSAVTTGEPTGLVPGGRGEKGGTLSVLLEVDRMLALFP